MLRLNVHGRSQMVSQANIIANKIGRDIARCGRSVVVVRATRRSTIPPHCYTIGNHLVGYPELFTFGGSMDSMLIILSNKMIQEKRVFPDRSKIELGGRFPCMAIHCSVVVRQEYTTEATKYLETDSYQVLQILTPDPFGKYPYDPACMPDYRLPVFSRSTR